MLVLGTRGSELALAQTLWAQKRILEIFPDMEISVRIIKTAGDADTTSSIRAGGSVGVFVKEIERALLEGEIDLAVHSMKDLPTDERPGLRVAAIPEREDPRDALVSSGGIGFSDLPSGSRIGTGSLRRQAQLLALRPDLEVVDIRGNINTRLNKLQGAGYDAVVVASAGLNRLGLQNRITERFSLHRMLPAPGQGALAIQARSNDARVLSVAAALDHAATSIEVRAERVFLRHIGGGCNVPVAAHARVEGARIRVDGLIIAPDGRRVLHEYVTDRPEAAGAAAAALADHILSRGGRAILDAL